MTTAKVAALTKCDGTGVSEELADKCWGRTGKLGPAFVAIVEFLPDEHTENTEGEKSVKLVIGSIEPALRTEDVAHLQSLRRALYRRRDPQPALTDVDEPTFDDLARAFRDAIPEGTSVSVNNGPEIKGTGKRS